MERRRPGRRALPALALAVTMISAPARGQTTSELPARPALEDFVRVAEERNPRLEAGRRRWRAEQEATAAAGSFPDPQLSFAWYAEEVETRVGPQKQRLSVRQRLPWFGTLGFRREAARQGAEAARAGYDDRRLEIRRDVTLAWLDLYWLGKAVVLAQDNLALTKDLERVIRERYRTGNAEHADLARVQVELGLAENRVHTLRDRLRPAIARMNEVLHREENAPVPLPEVMPAWPDAPETDRAGALDGSPSLREREERVRQAEAGRRLASRRRWPDWMVGVDWIRTDDAPNPALRDSGKDPVVVSVAVNLPLFRGKWDAPARAAEERVELARADFAAEEDRLAAGVERALFDWRDADRRIDLYESALLPKARESWESLDTAYRTGRGAFLDLIDAQRTLLDFELERERALTDRGRAAAEFRYLTGESGELQ